MLACHGHVRDLPAKAGSVKPDDGFAMVYETAGRRAARALGAIRAALGDAEGLILATDPDREGEAIAWQVLTWLREKDALGDKPVERVAFREITAEGVRAAMARPRGLDMDLVRAQQARRALDYLVGYGLSPLMWRKAPGCRSAGRVQSVALRLVCAREAEIEAFVAQEYWTVEAVAATAAGARFAAGLDRLDGAPVDGRGLAARETAEAAARRIREGAFAAVSVERRTVRRRPAPPFTTAALQQEAARRFGFGVGYTMRIAQALYEGIDLDGGRAGLITYMRTDGVAVAKAAVDEARRTVRREYGDEYLSRAPRAFRSRAVNVHEAHEATVSGVPRIGLEVGTQARRAFFVRNAGPAVLLFSYAVAVDDMDLDDGVAVPANGLRLAGGTIVDAYDAPAFLDHDAVAADAAHKVNGMLDPLTGGVCERTPQVRDALVAAAQANDAAVTDCSKVGDDDGIDELAGITGALELNNQGIAALRPGDFAGLAGLRFLQLNGNALSALPAGVFDGLGAVTTLSLADNAFGAGSLEDGVFEPLTRVFQLDLSRNPGSASFVPKADAGADLVLRAGESATLGGPGTGGGPWGMNVDYTWVEVDADDNPVADLERTEGLSATDVARPGFTAPALTEERVVRYRLAVQGLGHGGTDVYRASDTVTVTVRAAPAVTGVALTSLPRAGATYRRDETIEVSVTFSAPVTVTGPPAMTPTIGLEVGTVGTVVRRAAYARNAGPAVLVFGYTVTDADTDEDGIAVPENGILLAGGTIADAQGGAAALGHAAVAADAAHRVNGTLDPLIGGVCERTAQVRDALVAAVAGASDCSEVDDDDDSQR